MLSKVRQSIDEQSRYGASEIKFKSIVESSVQNTIQSKEFQFED